MDKQYARTVRAAVAETKSKFRLAEALAEDIPPRRRGGSVDNELSIEQHLAKARQAIIDAGGEARSVITLADYRWTALWAKSSSGPAGTFRWIPGSSFSAHNEARKAGKTYAEFKRKPMTTDETRAEAGWAGTDGQPTAVARKWTPQERAEVVKEAIQDDEVADLVAQDPDLTVDRSMNRAWQRRAPEPASRPEPELGDTQTVTLINGDIARAREGLTGALNSAKRLDLDRVDPDLIAYTRQNIDKVVALGQLVQLALGGAVDVDWDAEASKLDVS